MSRWRANRPALRKLSSDTAEYMRQALLKIRSRELVDAIFEQRIADFLDAGIAGRQAA